MTSTGCAWRPTSTSPSSRACSPTIQGRRPRHGPANIQSGVKYWSRPCGRHRATPPELPTVNHQGSVNDPTTPSHPTARVPGLAEPAWWSCWPPPQAGPRAPSTTRTFGPSWPRTASLSRARQRRPQGQPHDSTFATRPSRRSSPRRPGQERTRQPYQLRASDGDDAPPKRTRSSPPPRKTPSGSGSPRGPVPAALVPDPAAAGPPIRGKECRLGCAYPIDRFILAELEKRGRNQPRRRIAGRWPGASAWTDRPAAHPRRVEAFVNDIAPNAYERYVDRLLDSPHWASTAPVLARRRSLCRHPRHPLRQLTARCGPYRDWVIKACQPQHAFDEFTVEQLAVNTAPKPTPRPV